MKRFLTDIAVRVRYRLSQWLWSWAFWVAPGTDLYLDTLDHEVRTRYLEYERGYDDGYLDGKYALNSELREDDDIPETALDRVYIHDYDDINEWA